MLRVKNVSVKIEAVEILEDIDIEIKGFSSIIGRNGAGKTTLMKTIMNILKPEKGEIFFNGLKISRLENHKMTSYGIGYMPEDRKLVPELSVKDNLLMPLWASKNLDESKKLENTLSFIPELKPFLNREAYQLSGGQQKLVALGRAIIIGSNLLLLDEPFEGVAPALAERLVELIKELSKMDVITLITESDETYSKKIGAKVFRIERGKII